MSGSRLRQARKHQGQLFDLCCCNNKQEGCERESCMFYTKIRVLYICLNRSITTRSKQCFGYGSSPRFYWQSLEKITIFKRKPLQRTFRLLKHEIFLFFVRQYLSGYRSAFLIRIWDPLTQMNPDRKTGREQLKVPLWSTGTGICVLKDLLCLFKK
jgi:hypothetical protein